MCENLDSCLEQLRHSDNYDLAVGGSRQRILNSQFYSASEIFCFDEKIASFQPTLLMSKGFEFKSKVNQMILNAFEGGLFVKWDRTIQTKQHELKFELVGALSILHYLPVLAFVLAAGTFLALLSFLSERMTFQKTNQQSVSPFWKLSERFFDGKRHYLKDLPDKLFKNVSVTPKNK